MLATAHRPRRPGGAKGLVGLAADDRACAAACVVGLETSRLAQLAAQGPKL